MEYKLFRVRILNQMSFMYANLQVSVGLSGGLQTGETQDATQTVKKLSPEEKVGITAGREGERVGGTKEGKIDLT